MSYEAKKLYYQRPEVKARRKEYYDEYRKRPEYLEKRREYRRRHNSDPQVKKRLNEYAKTNRYRWKSSCNREYAKKRLHERQNAGKARAVEYKGGKCVICGKIYDSVCYDFHHINPSDKKFVVGHKLHYSFEKIKEELDKCILVCSNCHRLIHFKKVLSLEFVIEESKNLPF